MDTTPYQILDSDSEDSFGLADDYETALSIARATTRELPVGQTVLLTHKGYVIREFVLAPNGRVEEEEIR